MKWPTNGLRTAGILLLAAAGLTGCHRDMRDQWKYQPYEASDFFGDRRSGRPPVPGTVARGELDEDALLYTGKVDGRFSEVFPFAVDYKVLKRGQERFNIYCTPCHDYTGSGNGMIVQRGFRQPPSFHIQRLREAPPGYFFDVITNGFGVMYPYRAQVKVEDRWAIASYIKALQLSQRADLALVPPTDRPLLDHPAPKTGSTGEAHGEGGH